jgi:hypothetical protein
MAQKPGTVQRSASVQVGPIKVTVKAPARPIK